MPIKKVFTSTLLIFFTVVIVACKKDTPTSIDHNNEASLQGTWALIQQTGKVNGQQSGETTNFGPNEYLFEFNGKNLKVYSGNDVTIAPNYYTFKFVNGELLLRRQFDDSATVYKINWNGNNSFILLDEYTSINDQISIEMKFVRK